MTWNAGGYNGWFSLSNDTEQFQLRIETKAKPSTGSFATEAGVAAKLLQERWGDKPLYLALSGGIDSEFVANTLIKEQIPFTPVILKIGDLNKLETWYAEYWCYKNNIKPDILEYTLETYSHALAGVFPKLVQLKNYTQAPILLIYKHVHEAGGHCIYGGGDINLDCKRKEFYCNSLDFISDLVDRWNHPSSFFMYTPELALAYIKSFDISISEQYNKIALYNVAPRPKIDYVNVLHQHPELQSVRDKLFHMFKAKQTPHETNHWYGTKEQLVQDLQT
jgi:hypothetical protein